MKTSDLNISEKFNKSAISWDSISYMLKNKVTFDFDVYLATYGRNLQRPLIWSDYQKQEFIYSLLKRIYIQPFSCVVVKKKDGDFKDYVYQIIDGKQRLTTIFAFVRNEFSIELDGKQQYFKDLPYTLQGRIDKSFYCVEVYSYPEYPITDDEKLQWFKNINFAGTPQENDYIEGFVKI